MIPVYTLVQGAVLSGNKREAVDRVCPKWTVHAHCLKGAQREKEIDVSNTIRRCQKKIFTVLRSVCWSTRDALSL